MLGKHVSAKLIAILAAALICAGQAFAQTSLKVVPATGAAGQDVSVKVTLSSDKNIAAAEFQLEFDSAKLIFKQASKGSSAASMYMADPTVPKTDGQSTVGIDSSKLHIQLIDSTQTHPIASGSDREVVLLTFTIASGASGSIPITVSGVSLSDEASASVTATTTDGSVTVGAAVDLELSLTTAQAPAGSDVTLKLMGNVNRAALALGFSLVFDKNKLTLKSVERGADAPGPDTLNIHNDIVDANAAGKVDVSLFDLYWSQSDTKPLAVGKNREIYKVTFTIKAGVENGDIPVTVSGVEAATIVDELAVDLTYSAVGGAVTVGGVPGDLDGNNKIDVFDLLNLLKVMSGTLPSTPLSDLDGNGKTDVFDLLSLLRKMSGKEL